MKVAVVGAGSTYTPELVSGLGSFDVPIDELEPVGRRVDEDQLVHGQHLAHPAEPVDQLRGVRRPTADDCDPHPFTPVRVTPSMNARCARKNSRITGAITITVAAMVRFQLVWWALLNVPSP